MCLPELADGAVLTCRRCILRGALRKTERGLEVARVVCELMIEKLKIYDVRVRW